MFVSDSAVPAGRAGDRRERRRAATRRQVADSALRLALEHGVESVTVEQISEAADIAPRTFFNYFPAKEDALLPAKEAKLDGLRESLAGQPRAEDPVAAAWRALTAWALAGDLASDDALPRIKLALQNPSLSPRYLARYAAIEAVIAEHLAGRLDAAAGNGGTAVLRGTALAAALVGVFRAGVRCWALDPAWAGRPLPQVLDGAFAASLGGQATG
jgi:AcrR family transcriptional regulator